MAYKIYLSPSDQDKNLYAYGNTNEMIQCRRIADACETALLRCGFEVINNQRGTMEERVAESNSWGADLHIPIHTNAYDGEVSGTRMFYNPGSVKGKAACLRIFNRLAPITPGTSENVKENNLYETRVTSMTAVYIEVDFHDVPSVAKWITEHTYDIGEAIAHGVCDWFGVEYIEDISLYPDEPEWSRKEGYWAAASRLGIVDGTRANEPITRAELIAVLGRLKIIKK